MAIPAEERLLNLIIALMHARVRMTKDEIRASVEGYERDDPSWDEATRARRKATFERMFERDKDKLRRLGVPVVTVRHQAYGDDIGYRIDPAQAKLPPLDFTAAERAVLALAADYWHGVTLGDDARQALVKAASESSHAAPEALPFAALSTRLTDATALVLEAIQLRQAVTFEYASASSGTATRTVQPWKILLSGGAEYLIGHDAARDAPRTFRLSRVLGDVALTGEPGAFTPPADIDAALLPDANPGTARLAIRPEAAHALRSRGRVTGTEGDWDIVEVDYRHLDQLRDEVLARGGAVRALEPAELADAVRAHALAALEVARG
ncbi:YafY family protein [Demequina sp. NBRC 110055]|uniref:helix-turn-helix transcriptional regulator n=1 Tax=Demequina sp. NBRC 110055 TaxID=1570344 RepID=UPI000A00B286|nr:WYL domain-containing protein [Demequina sp. NBRC 110055]